MANVTPTYAPQSTLCPNCMEFIHRTRRPFRLIAAQIETFAAGVAVGNEIVKPLNLIRTLQLRRNTHTEYEPSMNEVFTE